MAESQSETSMVIAIHTLLLGFGVGTCSAGIDGGFFDLFEHVYHCTIDGIFEVIFDVFFEVILDVSFDGANAGSIDEGIVDSHNVFLGAVGVIDGEISEITCTKGEHITDWFSSLSLVLENCG